MVNENDRNWIDGLLLLLLLSISHSVGSYVDRFGALMICERVDSIGRTLDFTQ